MSLSSEAYQKKLEEENRTLRRRLAELEQHAAGYPQEGTGPVETRKIEQAIVESNIMGAVFADPDTGEITDANEEFLRIIGRTRAELAAHQINWKTITPPEVLEKEEQARAKMPLGQTRKAYEKEYFRSDGSRISVIVGGAYLDVERHRVVAFVLDNSERKRMQELLDRESRDYALLMQTSQDAIHVLAEDGRLVDWNDAFLAHLGYSPQEAAALNAADWDVQWKDEELRRQIHHFIQQPRTFETRHRRKDGRVLDVEISTASFLRNGQPYLYASARDISDRKRAEAALRASEARFRSLFEQTHDAVFILSLEGQHLAANQRAAEIFGYTQAELAQLSVKDTSAEIDQSANVIGRLAAGENIPPYERLFRKKNGAFFPAEVNVELVRDKNGAPLHIQSVLRDISQRKQIEDTLRAAQAELEQRVQDRTVELKAANHELETLLRTLAHDLRTPIRAIAGFSQVLTENLAEQLDVENRHLLSRMEAGAGRMGQLLEDLMAFMYLRHQPLKKERVDITRLAQAAFAELAIPLELKRSLRISIHELPPCIADPQLLRIVLISLLENAIKYTEPRLEAVIEVGAQDDQYYVKDNGIGFDPIYAEKIFVPFERLHRVNQFEGTGIGLAIVKRIIERHGGKIWVETQLDRGASFYFTLPAE